MSAGGYILIVLVVFVIFIALAIRNFTKKMYTPTYGEKIGKYKNPKKALLVVDVQEDLTGPKAFKPYKDAEEKISRINSIITYASNCGMEVAYIRHEFDDNFIARTLTRGTLISGHPGVEVDSRIKVVNQNEFSKRMSDAFSNLELEKFLISQQVDEIYIVGLDAVYCVYNTAIGALNRGYKVTIIKDAVMTHKSMNDVYKLYEKDSIATTISSDFIGG